MTHPVTTRRSSDLHAAATARQPQLLYGTDRRRAGQGVPAVAVGMSRQRQLADQGARPARADEERGRPQDPHDPPRTGGAGHDSTEKPTAELYSLMRITSATLYLIKITRART